MRICYVLENELWGATCYTHCFRIRNEGDQTTNDSFATMITHTHSNDPVANLQSLEIDADNDGQHGNVQGLERDTVRDDQLVIVNNLESDTESDAIVLNQSDEDDPITSLTNILFRYDLMVNLNMEQIERRAEVNRKKGMRTMYWTGLVLIFVLLLGINAVFFDMQQTLHQRFDTM